MLSYFPAPYPNEWWYSILCRYHVRSGNGKQQTTIRELFQGRITASISSVFPNSTILQVVSQLPLGSLCVEDVIVRHTLFPYFTRFFSLEKKNALLKKACLGETPTITSLRRSSNLSQWRPRGCALCMEEDRSLYGEAYWHIEHQIPFMEICPKHRCQLFSLKDVDASHLDYTFYPLESQEFIGEGQDTAPSWRESVAQILFEYEVMPLTAAITEGHSNLAVSLFNMGYGVIQNRSPNTILDAKRLYHDMEEHYGADVVGRVLGDICTINRSCKWATATPERYALLQDFAGISSEVVFWSKAIQEHYAEEMLNLQNQERHLTKKQVLERLHITSSQLNILLKRYQMEPFWRQGGGGGDDGPGHHRFSFTLNDEEYAVFKRALQKSGYRFDSHFIRQCLMEQIGHVE